MCSVVVATAVVPGVVLVLLQLAIVSSHSSKLEWDYPVLAARCRSRCLLRLAGAAPTQQKLLKLPTFKVCVEECLKTKWTKPGVCISGSLNVTDDSADSVFQETCIYGCRSDTDCPGIDKCCSHSCGASCRTPAGLISNPNLPDIPKNVSITEIVEKNATHITADAFGSWSLEGGVKSVKGIVFLVEERHHLGCKFSEEKLGPWTVVRKEIRPRVNLNSIMTPGRWYQIRVAAVNENGTRGFSEPSNHHQLSLEPDEPQIPSNITIQSVALVNGSIWAELHWEPPQSNLPIIWYRVCWGLVPKSTYLDSGKDASVNSYVKCFSVPKEQHSFYLRDLIVPNEFMVQVEANAKYCEMKEMGISGDMRFFIEEADGKLLWSTASESILEPHTLLSLDGVLSKPKIVQHRIKWNKDQLSAHVKWESLLEENNLSYELSWRLINCPRHKAILAATTDKTYFEINGLKFNSKYNVTLKTQSYMKTYESYTVFRTPLCEEIEKIDGKPDCKSIRQQNCNQKLH